MPPPEQPSADEAEVKPKQTRKKPTPAPKTPAASNEIDQLSGASGKRDEVAKPSPIDLGDPMSDEDE